MNPWEMAQDVDLAEIHPITGPRSTATVVCDHRPTLAGLLLAALSGAIVGVLLGWSVATAAAPRPAQATARVDLVPGLSPELTGAPLPKAGTTGVPSPAAGLTVDRVSSPARLPEGSGGAASAVPAGHWVAA